jgi:hypothetical protein
MTANEKEIVLSWEREKAQRFLAELITYPDEDLSEDSDLISLIESIAQRKFINRDDDKRHFSCGL